MHHDLTQNGYQTWLYLPRNQRAKSNKSPLASHPVRWPGFSISSGQLFAISRPVQREGASAARLLYTLRLLFFIVGFEKVGLRPASTSSLLPLPPSLPAPHRFLSHVRWYLQPRTHFPNSQCEWLASRRKKEGTAPRTQEIPTALSTPSQFRTIYYLAHSTIVQKSVSSLESHASHTICYTYSAISHL